MRHKQPSEQTRTDIAKAYRQGVRLKYSIAADHEINDNLPDLLDRFDTALMRGLPFEVDIQALVENDEAVDHTDYDDLPGL